MKKKLVIYAPDNLIWREVGAALGNLFNVEKIVDFKNEILGVFELSIEENIFDSQVELDQTDLMIYNQLVTRRGSYYNNYPMVRDEFFYLVKRAENLLMSSKPNYIVFSNIPHEGFDYILYRVAQKLNVKVIICHQSIFSNRFFLFETIEDYGIFETSKKNDYPVIDLDSYFNEGLSYMKGVAGFSPLPELIYYKCADYIDRISFKKFLVTGSFRHRALKFLELFDNYVYSQRKKRFFSKDISELISRETRYVYFPLHQQPELTTSILGGIYEDHLLAIEHLTKLLPEDVMIVVKENPRQTNRYRSSSFFKRLLNIRNVFLVKSSTSSEYLLRNSLCSATITGTIAWESAVMNKYCIVFGNTWYIGLRNIILYNDAARMLKRDFIDLISNKVEFDVTSCDRIFHKMPLGVVDDFYLRGLKDFDYRRNAQLVANAIESGV